MISGNGGERVVSSWSKVCQILLEKKKRDGLEVYNQADNGPPYVNTDELE